MNNSKIAYESALLREIDLICTNLSNRLYSAVEYYALQDDNAIDKSGCCCCDIKHLNNYINSLTVPDMENLISDITNGIQ